MYTNVSSFEQNPYWIVNRLINRVQGKDKRYRALAALTTSLKITYWFTLQARGNIDYTNDKFQQKTYATTASDLIGTTPKNMVDTLIKAALKCCFMPI